MKKATAESSLAMALDPRLDAGLAGIEKKIGSVEANVRFILAMNRSMRSELRDEKRYVQWLESEVKRLGRRLEHHGERVTVLHRPRTRRKVRR